MSNDGQSRQKTPHMQYADAEERAMLHGELIKQRRLDLGLSRPAFCAEMGKHGQYITPDYLNKLERGIAELARASMPVREGMRSTLGYSHHEWATLTGLFTPMTPIIDSDDSDLSLRALIERSGKTQKTVAEEADIDPTYLSRMIRGAVKWERSMYFLGLATSLNLTSQEIKKLRPEAKILLAGTPDSENLDPEGSQRVSNLEIPKWAQILKKRREEIIGIQEDLTIKGKFFKPLLVPRLERGGIHPTEIRPEQFARILKLLEWTPEDFARLTGIEVDLSGVQSMFTRGEQLGLYLERIQMTRRQLAELLGVDLSYITKLIEDRVNWVSSGHFKQIAEILCLTDVEIETLKVADRSRAHKGTLRSQRPSPELDEMFSKYMPTNKDLRDPAWRNFLTSIKTKATNTADDWYVLFLKLKSMGVEPE